MIRLLSLFLIIILIMSCKKEENIKTTKKKYADYLHLSHTRTNSNPFMDSIIEKIDYSKYKMLWLGGDLANLTSLDDETIEHVDSIFDLENMNTLWALGNHDYSDLNRVQAYTHRPIYYSYYKNGISFIVLDTQDSLSNIIGLQKAFFDNVIDTIEKSSHLIILHHKLIWMYGNNNLEPQIATTANGGFGDCFYCINPNNFYQDIYPKLLEVKEKGIEVICIAGDIGFQTNQFEYLTNEGIYFLASGIYYGSNENKALVFHHDITKKLISWEYKLTSDL